MEVGIRQLRTELARFVHEAQEGRTVTITDHGKPVARLAPLEGLSTYERLVAEGKITPAKRPKSNRLPTPLSIPGPAPSDLIIEERRLASLRALGHGGEDRRS